jgi:adenine phosphoribosyltransferase
MPRRSGPRAERKCDQTSSKRSRFSGGARGNIAIAVAGMGGRVLSRRVIFQFEQGKAMDLKHHIRQVPDFPKPGILFYDISTLLGHAGAWRECVRQLKEAVSPFKPDVLAGIESRGFLVAAPLALELGLGFQMIRKRGKLPGATISHTYDLEYGTDTIEIQEGAVEPGQRVVILDDLLATGGTLRAASDLLKRIGAEVAGGACIMELTFLNGRSRLDIPFETLLQYDD